MCSYILNHLYLYCQYYRMRYQALIVVLLFLAASCKSDDNKKKTQLSGEDATDIPGYQEDSLYQKVMGIHDSAMMLMSNVSSLNRKIKKASDLSEDLETKEEIKKVSQELEAANEGMMDWMRNFDPDLDSVSHEETMKYLESEKKKIEGIKKDMESAIENAEDILR